MTTLKVCFTFNRLEIRWRNICATEVTERTQCQGNTKVYFSLDRNILTWGFFKCVPVLPVGKQTSWKMSLEYCDRIQEFRWLFFCFFGLGFFGCYKVLNTMPAVWQPFACYIGTIIFQGMAWYPVTWARQETGHKAHREGELSKNSQKHMIFCVFLTGKPLSSFALSYITVSFLKAGLKYEGTSLQMCSQNSWSITLRISLHLFGLVWICFVVVFIYI